MTVCVIFGADVVCLCDIFTLFLFSCETHKNKADSLFLGSVQSQFIL